MKDALQVQFENGLREGERRQKAKDAAELAAALRDQARYLGLRDRYLRNSIAIRGPAIEWSGHTPDGAVDAFLADTEGER